MPVTLKRPPYSNSISIHEKLNLNVSEIYEGASPKENRRRARAGSNGLSPRSLVSWLWNIQTNGRYRELAASSRSTSNPLKSGHVF